jgi:hypothetical protein
MYSVFHLWQNLVSQKELLQRAHSLADFPYDYTLFSYVQNGNGRGHDRHEEIQRVFPETSVERLVRGVSNNDLIPGIFAEPCGRLRR